MIKLPDPRRAFEYENNFYLSCDSSRMAKILSHYDLFMKSLHVPGSIVECGVFKGASLARFAMFRELFMNRHAKKIIAFDAFGRFPETRFEDDRKYRRRFIQTSGKEGIGRGQLAKVLEKKGVHYSIDLIEGDINVTVPAYAKKNPSLKISFLNMDTDVYEPAVTILQHLYPRISRGGVLLIDDYGVFPGETKAVDDFFKGQKVQIRKLPYAVTPCYIIKE